MELSIESVILAASRGERIDPVLTESHFTLYYKDSKKVDAEGLKELIAHAKLEFGIDLKVAGGGAGCVRVILEAPDAVAMQQMVTSESFRKLTRDIGVDYTWLHDPPLSISSELTSRNSEHRVDLGIITPLPEEFRSLRSALLRNRASEQRISKGSLTFYKYRLQTYKGIDVDIVATFMSRMGNDSSAITTFQMIDNWNPKFLVLTGIAGAIDSKFQLGHVVFVDEIMRFDRRRKVSDSGTAWAPSSYITDRTAMNRAQVFLLEDTDIEYWQRVCQKNHKGSQLVPQATIENIACGDAVVDSDDLKAEIVHLNRTCKAIEMEAGGFLEAIINQAEHRRAIVVRGLSDYAANKASTDSDPEFNWREFAAHNSASFVVEFVRRMYPFDATDFGEERGTRRLGYSA